MTAAPYGFRIVGSCWKSRRLVDAAAAFSGYADCVVEAKTDSEAYLSLFQFGDDFRQRDDGYEVKTKGYDGPCWSLWLWWDIDRENDIEAATRDARRIVAYLDERYGLEGDELLIFFSGSKGYHVGLPTSLWQPSMSMDFHRVTRCFAEVTAEQIGIRIDTGIYDKQRAFRAPNSRHPKTSRYKRRLTFEELLKVSPAGIVERASEPLPFELPEPPAVNDRAVADWRVAEESVAKSKFADCQRRLTSKGSATLNRGTVDFIREGASEGDRHRLLFSAAANVAEFDCSPELIHALLTEPARDSGLPPKDIHRQIECGIKHARCEVGHQATYSQSDG